MSYSIIPELRGLRAALHWLRRIAPGKEEPARKKYEEYTDKIEKAFADDWNLLQIFRAVVEAAHFFGRVEGLQEGLELYEYAQRIQDDNTYAFRSMIRYIVTCQDEHEKKVKTKKIKTAEEIKEAGKALKEAISAKEVCKYLDKQIDGIRERPKHVVRMSPPEDWGCKSWTDALANNRSNVERLISLARREAQSDRYVLLMAWKTWGRTRDYTADESTRSKEDRASKKGLFDE